MFGRGRVKWLLAGATGLGLWGASAQAETPPPTLLVATSGSEIAAEGRPVIVKTALETVSDARVAEIAQAAPPEPAGPSARAAVDAIIVTGSRLRAGFNTPTPVTVVNSEQLDQKSAGTVFELVRSIPSFNATSGPSANSSGAQSASKANLNLRNLGAQRTLVLVNGRRHVSDGTNNVWDTNLLPSSLIDHVDIVTGGASAAYGSDAVAGVVNFVMKNHFVGFKADIRYGVSQRDDNKEYNPSFAYGASFLDDRLHLVVGGDWTQNRGVGTMLSRDWGRREPGIVAIANSAIPLAQRVAQGLAANVIAEHVETSAYNASGLIVSGPLKGIAFDDNGATHQFNYGTLNGGTTMIGGNNYGSFINPDQFLRAAYERTGAMSRLEYDITPDISTFGQVQYGYLKTYGRSFGARVPNFNAYPVLITNPFLPASVVSAMKANNLTQIAYSATRHDDLGSIASRNRTEILQGDWGIKGLFHSWSWDVNAGAGKATFAPNIHNTPRTADFYESAYVVTGADGKPACGPVATNPYFLAQPAIVRAQLVANLSPNCVPYNIFGTNLQQNQAALAYFNSASQADFEFRQYDVNANISGEPVRLPAGPLAVSGGVEYRKETLSSVNCPDCQKGALMNQNYSLFRGAVTISEAYGEAGAPIFRGLPFVKAADLNAAVRRTDYSTTGAVTTWKVGGTWDIDDAFRVRVTQSHDIRAPNINELYNPGSEGNPNIVNPFNGAAGFIKSNTIGNPKLKPEVSDTFTAGLVFQPSWTWARGFHASFDYYSIVVRDVIGTLAVTDILNGLYAGNSAYAKYITFDNSALGVARVDVPQLNLNALKTDGVDMELAYRVPMEALHAPGRLNLRMLGTYTRHNHTITATTNIDVTDTASAPRFRANFLANYGIGRFSTALSVDFTSALKYSSTFQGPDDPAFNLSSVNSINRNLWPAAVTTSLQAQYDVYVNGDRRTQIYGNIDNLFDTTPPNVAILINGSPYDLVGRAFKMGVRFTY